MDANGQRFWMLVDEAHWRISDDLPGLRYDRRRRGLRLGSTRTLPGLPTAATSELEEAARSRLEIVPQTFDEFGMQASWSAASSLVVATGALPGAVPIYSTAPGILTDLAIGYDGVLYMAVDGRVIMQDRRDRWDPVTLQADGFTAWRLAADPKGGVWVLDRTNRKVARLGGQPLPTRPYGPYGPNTFRPCEEAPDPPRLTVQPGAGWPPDEAPVAIACSPGGRVAVLSWLRSGQARVRCLTAEGALARPTGLVGALYPSSLAWVSDDQLAVLLSSLPNEAAVFEIGEAGTDVEPTGDFYPLRDHRGGPFMNGTTLPPRYPTGAGSAPLHHLSLPSYARFGRAENRSPIDSGSSQSIWHRLYLEAVIPPHCGITVWLAATDEPDDAVGPDDWHEHRFGERFARDDEAAIPRGAWVSSPSEIPFHSGLLACERQKNRAGLFTVLVQRPRRRVRTLRGRCLRVRVELHGDGRETPEISALRAYASRFSYLSHYLPELYQETEFGPAADAGASNGVPGRSSPADFLERFLDNFEGLLTPLEDRIAGAYLLTDPRTAPEEALEWLGSWIGVSFDPAYPPERRRRLIEMAPELFRRRGTARGLALALDVATGGAVSGGEIVILEDYRIRRTFATILGADLADERDPLLGGMAVSGNSYVGDTLFLGEERRKEFLALFKADLPKSTDEEAAVEGLFDRLAHRVTILVHQEVEPQDLGLIRRIVKLETPAHVVSRVARASHPFLVGMASLVGVDTYLADEPEPRPVRVGSSQLGLRDLVRRPASLDPRLEGGRVDPRLRELQRPVADPGPPVTTTLGASFRLDGSRSRPAPGRTIARYIWTRID